MRVLSSQHIGPQVDYRLISSACDTVKFSGAGPTHLAGRLRDGNFLWNHVTFGGAELTHLAPSTDSYLEISPPRGSGQGTYAVLKDALWVAQGTICCFSDWDIVAGAPDTLLFYERSEGIGRPVRLIIGDHTDLPALATSIGKGWRIIAGGK